MSAVRLAGGVDASVVGYPANERHEACVALNLNPLACTSHFGVSAHLSPKEARDLADLLMRAADDSVRVQGGAA